ncbi:class F sortase [Amycolatopsis sp. H20-H5]|uniref:class F sortase n=1 Tax=Amycolatopsis sp. H20-H5 TaxID=3046309 RepID=UPI002DBEB118|nr:class F sortase [Amycolatopsis sp. H20-H5]MEC3977198.1 class F sortase [Amycolatopsis sp. H20-H5]
MRTWLAGLSAAVATLAVAAGIIVLTWVPADPAATPSAIAADGPAALPGEDGAPVALPADSALGQRPGTVLLPGGGSARLVRSEVTSTGVLPIPRGLGDAAWWGEKLGSDHGVTLLSGHVNWAGAKGPFDELWSMRAGQDITVADAKGGQWVYRVSDLVTVHKDELPARAAQLFGLDGPPRLVLVTCGGDYLGGTDGYRDNRIVTAVPVSGPR